MGVRGVHGGAADHLEGLSRLVAGLCLLAGVAHADVTVTTTDDVDVDDAACSLREAIVAANTNADYNGCVRTAATIDTIVFDVGTGTPVITVTGSDLPSLTEATSFDGNTGGATRVAIMSGGGRSRGINYLGAVNPGGSAIRNLVVGGFASAELQLAGGDFVVEGNFLGTDPTGTSVAPGSAVGIDVCCGSGGNHIGGPTAAQRNVIVSEGNVAIQLGSTSSNVVQGNYIGTDVTGTQRIGGPFAGGISISNANGNLVGGPNAGEGNVIACFHGVLVGGNPSVHAPSTANIIQGNHIGTDVTGTVAIGSGGDGVVLSEARDTQIGGLGQGEGNVISGNHEGVTGGSSGVSGGTVDNTIVQGNLIGTAANGTDPIGNSSFGVNLGDDAAIEGNVIAFNGNDGIEANCGACIQRISRNAIHSNAGIGIDLNGGNPGVTLNDGDDSDSGPNGLQNFPLLDAVPFPGGTSIGGILHSTVDTTFRVEIFASDSCDVTGNGEGQEFVGANNNVFIGPIGDTSFTVTLDKTVAAGKIMTATAIAPDGSTSEFSPCTPAPPTTTTATSTTTTSTAPPPTTSTSAPVPTTSSTSTTTTSPPTTSSSSTTTSTSSPPTTSTTLVACGGIPSGPTFLSIDCRLAALLDHVNAEPGLGAFGPKLAHDVGKAIARSDDAKSVCLQPVPKKAKKRLQQVGTALTQFVHRLNAQPARKKLGARRPPFVAEAAPIRTDVKTLRVRLKCPDDVPQR